MPAIVILNPYSNRWNAQKRWSEAEEALKETGLDFSLVVSEEKGKPIELAEEATRSGFSPIIVAGGDGTIGEVVNGIARVVGEKHLGVIGVIPLGTANDFACNLGIPLNLAEATKVIALNHTRTIDVCKAGEQYFVNNSAMGLEPYITTLEKKMTLLKGVPRYLAAALKGIVHNPCWQATIQWEGGSYEGPLTLISVGNAPRTGGLFYMAPHADPADGKLTAVLAYKKSWLSLLALLPKTMTPKGKFIYAKGVQEIHTNTIRIRLQSLSPAHADGELFPQEIISIDYSILPLMLDVLVPPKKS